MAIASAMGQRPDRMTITDLDSGRSVEMQYNPTEIEETLDVAYGKLTPPGASRSVLQYTSTSNMGLSFELNFDALSNTKEYDIDDAANARRFLLSLCYSKRGANTIRAGAPPRLLFIWPNLYTLTCKLTKYKGKFTRFAQNGKPNAFVCTLSIEEIGDMRISSEDLIADGTQRAEAYDLIGGKKDGG